MEKLVRLKINLYLRNEPNRSAVGTLMAAGTTLKCVESVKGELVEGIDDWYKDQKGLYFWSGGVEEIEDTTIPTENVIPPIVNERVVIKIVEETQTREINLLPQFRHGEPNLADDENTKRVRKYIKHEFGLNFETDCLQCVEYAQYRVKQKLGIWIEWPTKAGRDAKYWPSILRSRYKISEKPVVDSVASFDAPSLGAHGHVVFVENIFPNGEIEVSEVNLPHDGIYNLRRMTPAIWRDRYNGKFISFS